MIEITYWGHACIQLSDGETTLIFDPFISHNPMATIKPNQVKCDYILVSHGHFDHFGDTKALAKVNGATVIGIPEICAMADFDETHGMNLGGSYKFPFGKVKMVQAFHSGGAPGACAAGFIVEFGGKTFYFAGDTALFGDMALFAKYNIDYAFLPIGDNFTMGIDDATEAAKLIKAKNIVPIHYNTWPPIAADPTAFKTQVEKETASVVHIVKPNESIKA